MENRRFWSEIGWGFQEAGCTHLINFSGGAPHRVVGSVIVTKSFPPFPIPRQDVSVANRRSHLKSSYFGIDRWSCLHFRIWKKIIDSLNSSSDPDPRYTAMAHRRDKVKGALDGQELEKKLRESRVERDRDWANDEHTAGQRNDRRHKRVQLNSRPVNRHEPRGGGL